ncbi:MAG: hypothetical protein IJP76_05130 [Paludibacteraceae bacterium]|nr:hypothetical protein [Paludibacteraceae bacterium]
MHIRKYFYKKMHTPDNIQQNGHKKNRKAPQVTAQYGRYNPPTKNEHSAWATAAFILYRADELVESETIQDNTSSRGERTAQRDKWSPPTIPQAHTKAEYRNTDGEAMRIETRGSNPAS